MDNDFKICCSVRGLCAKGCGRQDKQLNTYDYLAGIPGNSSCSDLVEVQFKHTRKGYYRNDNHLPLEKGDMVAVEASPGHDIGVVTLTGQLVPLQIKKANLKPGTEIKRVYRKARPVDLEQYEAAKALEQDTMIRSRQIAKDLNLNMKIGDVEYQGDGNKAIFYYIADARVDFRQLIKVLADAFHVRIEMKQIGARQEAGRIGGIGPCGRELCCATWMKNFNSVSTTAARYQDISPNPQKLAGQCAKLKCCLNYEVDTYVEASRKLPPRDITLETADATYYIFKTDILAGLVTYSTDRRMAANLVTISADRAQEIIKMNKEGLKPAALDESEGKEPDRPVDLVEQEDLHRFDKSKRKKANNAKRRGQGPEGKRDSRPRDAQRGNVEENGNSENNEKVAGENGGGGKQQGQPARERQQKGQQPRDRQSRDGQSRDSNRRERQEEGNKKEQQTNASKNPSSRENSPKGQQSRGGQQKPQPDDAKQMKQLKGEGKQQKLLTSDAKDQKLLTGEAKDQKLLTGDAKDQKLLTGDVKQQKLLTGETKDQKLLTGDVKQQKLLTGENKQPKRQNGDARQQKPAAGDGKQKPFAGDGKSQRQPAGDAPRNSSSREPNAKGQPTQDSQNREQRQRDNQGRQGGMRNNEGKRGNKDRRMPSDNRPKGDGEAKNTTTRTEGRQPVENQTQNKSQSPKEKPSNDVETEK